MKITPYGRDHKPSNVEFGKTSMGHLTPPAGTGARNMFTRGIVKELTTSISTSNGKSILREAPPQSLYSADFRMALCTDGVYAKQVSS